MKMIAICRQHEKIKKGKNAKRASGHFKSLCAQVTLEFIFGMIIVLLAMYGSMMIFRWAGISFAERRMVHERVLLLPIVEEWTLATMNKSTLTQVDPHFYKMRKMCAVFGECYPVPK